jgi:hypothetical protein
MYHFVMGAPTNKVGVVLVPVRGVTRTLVFWVCNRDVSLQYEDCDIQALLS